MRACAYIRVSAMEWGRGGSLNSLKRIMEEKAAEQGVPILGWFEDMVDGTEALGVRPGGMAMLDELSKQVFDIVVVWSLDRLGRTRQVAEAGIVSINERGAGVRLLTEFPVASHVLVVD